MPHDKNGVPLAADDKVTVECVVESICEGEYCTANLRTVEVMPGTGRPTIISVINAKQLVKVVVMIACFLWFSATATAGPIRDRLAARRGASSCTTCSQSAATVPAPVATPKPLAGSVSAADCPSGKCARTPTLERRGLIFRR